MWSLRDGDRRKATVVLLTLITTGACAQRPTKPMPVAPTPTVTETPAAAQPPPQEVSSAVQDASPEPLHLYEVRVVETAGQRSVLFRFSRPPEGIDYFPLRAPSRLVIDVKGPIEPLPNIHTYKAADSLVSAVRVGNYEGRMRLVIGLKEPEVPQFSVDNYDTLITASIGEKINTNGYAGSNAQVLFLADEVRNGHRAPFIPVVDKPVDSPNEDHALSRASSSPEGSRALESDGEAPPVAPPSGLSSPPEPEELREMAQAVPPAESPPVSPAESRPLGEEPLGTRAPSVPSEETPAPEFRPPPTPAYTGRKISLDFKNADIHDVLRILADVSGLNIVATDDVKARVTLRLVEVPWDQALDVVLQANGLEMSQIGNVITISTARRLEAERNARLAAQTAQQKLAPLETEYVRVNYVKATDVVTLVTREVEQRAASAGRPAAGARTPARPAAASARRGTGGAGSQVALMSPRGTIAADATTNVVIIRDVRENIAALRELIRNIDVQTPQVVIESYIVTANENITRDLGIQWGYNYVASPETGNPTGVNFPGRIGLGGSGLTTGIGNVPFIADFPAGSAQPGSGSALDLLLGSLDGSQTLNMRLTALEREGKARVISRPRVVTLNNTPANIRNRREVRVPVISGNVVVGGAGTTGGGDAFEEFDVGITLDVTPQISSDGFVLLNISAESSELTDASVAPSGAGSTFPVIPDVLTRTTSSNVLIRAGDTFVLGGILQDNLRQQENGIPYLRNTPMLGWLFKGRSNTRVKDELLIFITPKLVAGVSTVGQPSAQQLWESRPRESAPQAMAQP